MYLSRVEIDLKNRKKIKNLSHVGAFHHWVEESFPEEIKEELRTRKLWRVDQLGDHIYLLLVSAAQPQLAQLERYGIEGTAESKLYHPFLDRIEQGEKMRFRVKLNPIMAQSTGSKSGERGKLHPLYGIDKQKQFLLERAEKNGFSLADDDFTIVETGNEILRKKGEAPVKIVKAVYEGILTVQDLGLFKKVLVEGIGKKKAYGFGLMTVIPIGR